MLTLALVLQLCIHQISHADEPSPSYTALKELSLKLDQAYSTVKEASEPFLLKTSEDDRYQFTVKDSKRIRQLMADYLNSYHESITQFRKQFDQLVLRERYKDSIFILSEIIRLSSLTQFYSLIIDAPPIGIILLENDWGPHNRLIHESLDAVQRQLHPNQKFGQFGRGHRNPRPRHEVDALPTIADIANNNRLLYNCVRNATPVTSESSELFEIGIQAIDTYFQAIQSVNSRMDTYFRSSPLSRQLYNARSFLLYLTGLIYMPKEYGLKKSDVDASEHLLEPGDISLISHELKLTNLAFTGVWTHAILYLGAPQKLFSYFDTDGDTKKYFASLCTNENLQCDSFESYFQIKFSDKYNKFIQKVSYEGESVHYKTIESKGDGVIFSDIYSALRKDRWATLRPRLTKLQKAIAVMRAIEYVGTPYDYDFDVLTQTKLVCTEMIVNIYDYRNFDLESQFRWSYSKALGRKVYYATDIGKTYFESPQKGLEFVFMLTPDSRPGQPPRFGNEQEFKTTLY